MSEEEDLVGLETVGRAEIDATKSMDVNDKQFTFWVNKERIPHSCSYVCFEKGKYHLDIDHMAIEIQLFSCYINHQIPLACNT